MDNILFQQAKDLKNKSIEDLRRLCSDFADTRKSIDLYIQEHNKPLELNYE